MPKRKFFAYVCEAAEEMTHFERIMARNFAQAVTTACTEMEEEGRTTINQYTKASPMIAMDIRP